MHIEDVQNACDDELSLLDAKHEVRPISFCLWCAFSREAHGQDFSCTFGTGPIFTMTPTTS